MPVRLILLAWLAAGVGAFLSAHEARAQTLETSSKWLLRYDEDRCRALREFGTGENLVTLWLDQSGPEPAYNLSLVGDLAGNAWGSSIGVAFSQEGSVTRSYVRSKAVSGKPIVSMFGVAIAASELYQEDGTPPTFDAERAAKVDRIALTGKSGKTLVLNTGSMGEILKMMQTCSVDLYESLTGQSSSEAAGQRRAPLPEGNVGEWITPDDYPATLARAETTGLVRFRLTVNSAGRASACQVISATRSAVFADVTCLTLLQRARFKPAMNAAGQPVAGYWTSSVRFQVPD